MAEGGARLTRSRPHTRLQLTTTGPFNREVEGLGVLLSPRSTLTNSLNGSVLLEYNTLKD